MALEVSRVHLSSALKPCGILKIAVGACLVALLSACGPYRFGELRPISVNVVEKMPKAVGVREHGWNSGPILQLAFGSDVNFIDLADRYGYNMGVDIRWCSAVRDDDQQLRYPYFFLGPIQVRPGAKADVRYPPIVEPMRGSYVYHAYLAIAQTIPPLSVSVQGTTFHPYDLSKNPKDVCLRVRGGNMVGIHGHSEFVRFTTKMIRDALEEK